MHAPDHMGRAGYCATTSRIAGMVFFALALAILVPRPILAVADRANFLSGGRKTGDCRWIPCLLPQY